MTAKSRSRKAAQQTQRQQTHPHLHHLLPTAVALGVSTPSSPCQATVEPVSRFSPSLVPLISRHSDEAVEVVYR